MSTPTAQPRPAATVIVLRPASPHPFEVLMVRRNDQVAFMAGAYVFPGGRVDATDDASPAAACDGLERLGRCADLVPADEARFRVAAIRELLEEAGVLLARRDGRLVDHVEAAALRQSIDPKAPFAAQLAARGLVIALDLVMPFAHWVTPEIEIRRFDTRFLLARMPEGQDASHDAGETTALEWLAPLEAIARAERHELLLPPPTWLTLARLARLDSIDAAWAWASTTAIVRVMPGFFRDDRGTIFTLPGAPDFPLPPGCEPFAETHFQLVDGRWTPVRHP
jgi:8-oxo-dGTP pyrophosphatase MutT (NUDIX family)